MDLTANEGKTVIITTHYIEEAKQSQMVNSSFLRFQTRRVRCLFGYVIVVVDRLDEERYTTLRSIAYRTIDFVQLFVPGGSVFEDLSKPRGQDQQLQNTSQTSTSRNSCLYDVLLIYCDLPNPYVIKITH